LMTTVAPVPRKEPSAHPAAERVFFTASKRVAIPAAFTGNAARISTFSLSGKLLNSTVTRERSIQLDRTNRRGDQVSIVKIEEIR
jgi:hypothetical protein